MIEKIGKGNISAKIIADSINEKGVRITTFEIMFPRWILSEINTHRVFSRNSFSSRAFPISKMIDLVKEQPAMPIHWGKNQSGMQAKEELDYDKTTEAIDTWLLACGNAIISANMLNELGLHKQVVNRLLEPFQMMKTIVTATSFDNFFALRYHSDAQPEIHELARTMLLCYTESEPELLQPGEWHTPYVNHERDEKRELKYYVIDYDTTGTEADDKSYYQYLTLEEALKVSCSCCAQVSYRKLDDSIEKALTIYDKLVGSEPKHSSAFEHCATPIGNVKENSKGITHQDIKGNYWSGNFKEWIQYRQLIPGHVCEHFLLKE